MLFYARANSLAYVLRRLFPDKLKAMYKLHLPIERN